MRSEVVQPIKQDKKTQRGEQPIICSLSSQGIHISLATIKLNHSNQCTMLLNLT
jgi:hypothetical protein